VAEQVRGCGCSSGVLLADLADENACRAFADQAWNWRQGVDVWINNAGADVLTGDAADWDFERKLSYLWAVDVLGTVRLSRRVGQKMAATDLPSRDRAIVNMGWDQAETGMGGDSGEMFATVKGAVMAFTRSLARSLAPRVRVNCVAPGWIRTAWGQTANAYWQQRASRESLLQRWGTPDDVAAVACFLASPAAAFITGQIVAVNGGLRRESDERGGSDDG
jgi:3-oxoacyl-[acyl-carrier protein] reductase